MENKLQAFEKHNVRSIWDEEQGKWWFSVVDVVGILTEQPTQRGATFYWGKLKQRLKEEGASELLTNCQQLKLEAADGKKYLTDVADTEQILRLIQSIPSKKAEPFKMWLAKVGRERIDEAIDPELSIDRAIQNYRKLGYSENWINQRIKSIEVRKALTDEWDKSGVKQGEEYAFLTDLMTKTWSGMTTKQYKNHKNLKKENLRDNMTNLELIINMLAEATTTELSAKNNPQNLQESASVAYKGAAVAKNARLEIEQQGGKVITSQNAKQLGQIKEKNVLPNNTMDEGYIKYKAQHENAIDLPFSPLADELIRARDYLYTLGFVGVYDNGIGFGNCSFRTSANEFVITGSATGEIKNLSRKELCLVEKFDIEKNTVWSKGAISASSESMTHGAVYSANDKINCVLHIHSRKLFDFMKTGDFHFTAENIPYGTPQMAIAVMDEVKKIGAPHGIMVMLGHDEGIIAFGEDINSALEEIKALAA